MSAPRTLIFSAPQKIEVRELSLPALSAGQVLVETICSAISAGTEMLLYQGQFPRLSDPHDQLSSDLNYPLSYGYACVGRVTQAASDVPRDWLGRHVFAFRPHASAFVAQPAELIEIPESLSADAACFLPAMETAVNLIHDGAPILGERALVIGQGIVGLLASSLLSEFPLEVLVVIDQFERRRAALTSSVNGSSPRARVAAFDSKQLNEARQELGDGADLTFELSGSPAALNDAIALTTFSGRIVIGSWYGAKRAEIDLGGAFHRSRIQLIASQVSTIAPQLSSRWDKARRFQIAWRAIERIHPEKWITHRFSLDDASRAYKLLAESPGEALQVVFDYQ